MTSNPTSISQKAALAALTMDQSEVTRMVGAFAARRDLISDLVSRIPGASFPRPDGAFYLFVDVRDYVGGQCKDDVALSRYLLRSHMVATVPGSAFGDPHAVRLSYACSERDIIEGVGRLSRGLEALRTG